MDVCGFPRLSERGAQVRGLLSVGGFWVLVKGSKPGDLVRVKTFSRGSIGRLCQGLESLLARSPSRYCKPFSKAILFLFL